MHDARSILDALQSKPLKRSIAIERKAINKESRTVRLAFASDKPIEHWFGKLRLSMDQKHVRTERFRQGAAVLVDHNVADQVGVVESFSFDSDGIARATVRFSRSARGEEVFTDIVDGIRRNVSVGFMVHELELESEEKGELPVYRSNQWEPYELSIVSVPADISVGVGRSNTHSNSEIIMDTNSKLDKASELMKFGELLMGSEGRAIATDVLTRNSDATQEDLRIALKAAHDAKPQIMVPPRDPESYSYGGQYRAAQVRPRYGKLTAFTGEGAEERAFRFGQWILGGVLGNRAAGAWCLQNGISLSRAGQVGGVNEKGGYLVPDEFGRDFVQLIERYGVFRQHARIIEMNSDRKTDFVLNGELESEFVGEMEAGTDQDLDFGQISYTARKHMVLVPMSSEVVEDSAVSIGDHIADASARAFAEKEDRCGFLGDATSTYGGMVGITHELKSVDGTIGNIKGLQVGTGNLYSELVLADFEGVLGRLPDYADTGNAKWFVSRKFYHNVMMKILLSASGVTATEIEDGRNRKFLGYPVVFTPVMPSTEANSQVCAIFGDLRLGARLADRRMFTTAIDESILYRQDALLFRATARFDINCSFGVGDTVEAGPIVGLITAAS